MKYLIIIEKSETGYSAYSPDLPGCVSTGDPAGGNGKKHARCH